MSVAGEVNPMEDLTQASKDLAHIGIGLAVLAFQKAQVQRRALERAFRDAGLDPRRRMARVTRCTTDHR